MNQKSRTILYTIFTIFIMAFIFFQSSLPADLSGKESSFISEALAKLLNADLDLITTIVRKTAHFMEYLLLGASLFATVRSFMEYKIRKNTAKAVAVSGKTDVRKNQNSCRLRIILPWLIGALYSVTDEIHQNFVPGRSCEATDMLIDSLGVLAGVMIAWKMTGIHHTKS